METLAAAVHHAHRAGLAHRDLKPANVLLTDDVVLKITDFGLAKRPHGEPGVSTPEGQTQSGALVGTPTYMAPEQVAGGRGAVGPAADTYALGVIFYELLTGRPPFQGDSALEVLRKVQDEEPRPPGRLQPLVPRDLETICLKCLEKEPRRRYATAAALAEDFRRFQAGEPIAARPVGRLGRTWRWCRRNPVVAGLMAAVALLLVVLAAGSFGAAVSYRDKVWEAKLEAARAHRRGAEPGRRDDALKALAEAAQIRPTPELRNEVIACLALLDVRVAASWDGIPPGTTAVRFDEILERYARLGPDPARVGGDGRTRRQFRVQPR